MKITFGGVRGSNPTARPEFMKFGGETTSVLVQDHDGYPLVIDAGTGITNLGAIVRTSAPEPVLKVLLTHYHLDHLAGLPTLCVLYMEGWHVDVTGPRLNDFTVSDAVPRVFSSPLWPFEASEVPATLAMGDLPAPPDEAAVHVHGLRINWCKLHHPGDSVAYRVEDLSTGVAMVFATDVEWALSTDEERNAFFRLCREPSPPSLLVFDGHFASSDYENYRGWGHSTWRDAVEVARQAHAGKLLVTHHAPSHDDTKLTAMEAELEAAMPGARLARQGMELAV